MQLISPRKIAAIALLVSALLHTNRACAGPLYTFDNPPTTTPFAVTEGGVTATFGSPAGSGGFIIQSAPFRTPFSGNALFNNGVTSNTSVPLSATFSQGVHQVSMDFGTLDPPGRTSSLTLLAFSGGLNGTLVGSETVSGTRLHLSGNGSPGGMTPNFELVLMPQGTLSFSSTTAFDTIELVAGPGVNFAIDNLLITIPEPATWTLAGVALAGVGIRRWRRDRRSRI